MIDLRTARVTGDNEVKFAEQLTRENISFRFGEVRAGPERQSAVFLTDQFAVSFSDFSPGVEETLRKNKFTPKKWSGSELRWEELALRRQLQLHR